MPPGSIGDYGYFNSQSDSDVEAEDDQARPSSTSTNPRNRPSLGRFNPRGGLLPPSTPTRRTRPREESIDDPFRPARRPRLGDNFFSSNNPQPRAPSTSAAGDVIDLTGEPDYVRPTPARHSTPAERPDIKQEPEGSYAGRGAATPPSIYGSTPSRTPPSFSSSQRSASGVRGSPSPRVGQHSRNSSSAAATYTQFAARSSGPGIDRDDISLSAYQQRIVDHVLAGNNTFFTGSAGTGKSRTVAGIVAALQNVGKKVRVVAPTGRAAYNIGGTTTWSFAGWTPDDIKKALDDLEERALRPSPKQRIRETDVLIIDEISMVPNHFLQRLDCIMKKARDNDDAFGGVQIVVTGDFAQLPPIKPFEYCMHCGVGLKRNQSHTEYKCRACKYIYLDVDKWAFKSNAWREAKFSNFQLQEIFRQSDPWLAELLQRMRKGQVNPAQDGAKLLNHPCDVEGAVQLHSRNVDVRKINDREFNKLPGEVKEYWNLDFFKSSRENQHLRYKGTRSKTDHSLVALEDHAFEVKLSLKVGMQVVLLVNLDIAAGLINGSTGKIVRFEAHDSESVARTRTSSRDDEHDGPRDANDHAERNVAENVSTVGGSYRKVQTEQIKEFMAQERNKSKCLPVVKFANGIEATIFPFCRISAIGDYPPYSLIGRTQIPLAAAWAFTIHKSQGMTMDRVIVDLSKTFEEGQDYVALSRARSLSGLRVDGLSPNFGNRCINPQVKEFLDQTFGQV